jgi:MFS family permease
MKRIAFRGRNPYDSAFRNPNPTLSPMSEPTRPEDRPAVPSDGVRLYGLEFWVAYLANLLIVTANTLTFRFADFVGSLDGTAADTGFILGVGTGVSVLVRLWMGRVVDQTGPRWLWVASAGALVMSCLAFIPLRSLGPTIYLVRILYACGIAGVFSCSVIHLCTDTPIDRRAELIGTLGTSGFIGMILGPQLGDWIFRTGALSEHRFFIMFVTSAAMDAAYLLLVVYMTRHSARPTPHEPPPFGRMLVEFWPGTLVGVAMMMGIAQTVPATFLTLFCVDRHLEGIGKFFWFYAPTAIFMRLVGRQWPDRIGRRAAALIGLVSLGASMLLYLMVDSEWDLAWPALAAGTGQALLFPAVTTLGAESFPERYRATGTTLILSFVDVGGLCGAPTLGMIIYRSGFESMFLFAAATVAVVSIAFLISSLRRAAAARASREPEIATEEQLGEW